tara:strand:- start:94 stop:435 length:342 start_codon:yes stop_codon:yes gene_type:complete
MTLDYDAIRKAYPDAVTISDTAGSFKAFKEDGTQITLVQSNIDAAKVTLEAEASATLYQRQRTGEAGTTDTIYPDLGEQFDLLFKDIAAGTLTTSGNLYTALKAVKDKYPKPS